MIDYKYLRAMKTLKITKLIVLLLSLVVVASCVQDDDFDTPDVTITEPTLNGQVITLDALASALSQEQNPDVAALDYEDETTVLTFEDTTDYLEGYVISSDEGGNFFEELVLQDKPENPTTGIKLLIDESPLFTRYQVGRKIYVKLNGLSIGITNGVLTIGMLNGSEVDKIPAPLEEDFLTRSADIATLVPLSISLSELSSDKTNLYIQLQDVQFNRDQVLISDPLTFAGEATDEFDGERILESCTSSASAVFSTSTFADFKSLKLPTLRGSMNAILTRNFFGDEFNIVINSIGDINFDNSERCDPIELDCGLASAEGEERLFEEDFESQSTNSLISGNGWTNYIETGTEGWEAFSSTGTNASLGVSARVGSFRSGDDSTIAWLITPEIDLDAQDGEVLRFKTSNSFSDSSELELLFSPDWDGTEGGIANATWGVIPAAYITQDSDFFGEWFDSGIVDLSCQTGSIHIAFRYTGSGDADFDGTYELDDIFITY